MANWPEYYIEVEGNTDAIEKIEEILRGQTRGLYLQIITGRFSEKSSMKISGITAYGVHDFDKIVKLVIENKMDLEFEQSDIQGDTKFYGKWEKGEEKEWEEGPCFTEEELAEMEALNEEYDYKADLNKK